MLDPNDRRLWLLGILACPVLVAIYTTAMLTGGTTGTSFSFGHFVGASLANLVIGSLPALTLALFYRFQADKQKNIFSVWTAGMLIVSLLVVLGTLH